MLSEEHKATTVTLSESRLVERVSALEAENKELREALRNIADEEAWDGLEATGADIQTARAAVGIAVRVALRADDE